MEDSHFYARTPIDALYRWFAGECRDTSTTWARLCEWIARTPEINARLDALPGGKRQPNLFLAAIRYLDGPTEPGADFVGWVDDRWDVIRQLIATHATQTNEPRRAAVLMPILASLPQPIALLEVGCSAGLLLGLDRYRYRYDGDPVCEIGDGRPQIPSRYHGAMPARALPDVVFRLGLDRNPLDVADPDVRRWLRALVWPGDPEREERLVACLDRVAEEPPPVIVGDAVDDLDRLLARVPAGTTRVVMHSAMLAYLTREGRERFVAKVRASGARWVSFEGRRVLPEVAAQVPVVAGEPHFICALDGRAVAVAHHHGRWVRWL